MNYIRCLARRRLHGSAHNLVVPVLNNLGKQLVSYAIYVLPQRSIWRHADIMSRVKHCCDSTPIASPSVLA
jgi:hypothetical protein